MAFRRKLKILEEQVISVSRGLRSRVSEVKGQLQEQWRSHRRAKADQVRDKNVQGEYRDLVESNGELGGEAQWAGRGKLQKEVKTSQLFKEGQGVGPRRSRETGEPLSQWIKFSGRMKQERYSPLPATDHVRCKRRRGTPSLAK